MDRQYKISLRRAWSNRDGIAWPELAIPIGRLVFISRSVGVSPDDLRAAITQATVLFTAQSSVVVTVRVRADGVVAVGADAPQAC
jgi:hypothetical protein